MWILGLKGLSQKNSNLLQQVVNAVGTSVHHSDHFSSFTIQMPAKWQTENIEAKASNPSIRLGKAHKD